MENTLTLAEIIFRGTASKVDLGFLGDLLERSHRVRFNAPETENKNHGNVLNLLKNSGYVDIAFDSFSFNSIPNVFVNIVSSNERIELLFFLDLKDLNCETLREAVETIIAWAKDFGSTYKFDFIICQPDNAEIDEYYFLNGKYGESYRKLT